MHTDLPENSKEEAAPVTCLPYIRETLEWSRKLVRLAEIGAMECGKEECLLFYGVILDSAYRIKTAAEARLQEFDVGGGRDEES